MIKGEELLLQKNENKREWLKYIDLDLVDIYPLQVANCDRLLLNDSVYIFDEVGSGKTISSGLMALDYLSNNLDKDVLIITTNALYKKGIHSEYGQFLKDWFEKLPFEPLNLESRIKVTNNHYSHFRHKADYGLIIIDEAQLFLNNESKRYKALTENISAQKVVFLSATPIKNSKSDLQVYVDIAKKITGKEISNDWIENISTVNKQKEEIICNTFDVSAPVTRYFKDTIMSLNIEEFKKSHAKRLLPHLWHYNQSITKNEVLLENINSKYEQSNENNFVIFTRFVEKEAYEIANYLKINGFFEHNNSNLNSKTYAVVTGENAYKLSEYSGLVNLPTVLILTYQIAEQGVNLPGYNHVINYHISAFPSALEQRFGRIDRMGKNGSSFEEIKEINMCFLIAKDTWDTNTWNFYCAISIYLINLISYLPSKNTILSEEILDQYIQTKSLIEKYIEKTTDLINHQIQFIVKYFKELNNPEIDQTCLECKCDVDLFTFLEENSIEFNTNIDEKQAVILFKKDVEDVFTEIKSNFDIITDLSIDKYRTIIKSTSDEIKKSESNKIFYINKNSDSSFENIKTLDAINDCGENISNNPSFIEYRKNFQEHVKFPILVNKYLSGFNQFFEETFIKNDFNVLFPFNGYYDIFEKLINSKFNEINKEDKNIIIENCDKIVNMLPFFKMCKKFKKCLIEYVYTKNLGIRSRFDSNPFFYAISQTGDIIKQDTRKLGLSNNFVALYWEENIKYTNLLKYEFVSGYIQASNWYKLSYHYTRKEVACFMDKQEFKFDHSENLFHIKEKCLKFLGQNYKLYKNTHERWVEEWNNYNSAYNVAMDGENHSFDPQPFLRNAGCFEPEYPKIIEEYENALSELKSVCKKINDCGEFTSLFNHYIFTEKNNFRTDIGYPFNDRYYNPKVLPQDLWTQGILYEIRRLKFENCEWGNLLELPDDVKKISLF